MQYSIVFVALAVAVSAESAAYTNAFTSYLSQTDSRGVVTGMPPVNTNVNMDVVTSQALAVTTQPAVVTSQPAVATSPAGTPSVIPTLSTAAGTIPLATGSSGNNTASNSTVSTGSLKASSVKASASSTASNAGGSGSSSGTVTTGSSSSSSTGKSSAGMVEPALGLGLAGVLFAAFL